MTNFIEFMGSYTTNVILTFKVLIFELYIVFISSGEAKTT